MMILKSQLLSYTKYSVICCFVTLFSNYINYFIICSYSLGWLLLLDIVLVVMVVASDGGSVVFVSSCIPKIGHDLSRR